MSEDDLRQLWVEEYKASYDPHMEGNTYHDWFAEILSEHRLPHGGVVGLGTAAGVLMGQAAG